LYSNPENIENYARLFDSIATIEKSSENAADAQNYLGISHYVAQEYEEAINYYLEAARILEPTNDHKKLSRIYSNLAASYNIRGDFKKTEDYFLKAETAAKQMNDSAWAANVNMNLGVLYNSNKQYSKAEISINKAISYLESKKDSLNTGIAYMNLGNAQLYQDRYEDAIPSYEQSMNLIPYDKIPIVHSVAEAGIGMALMGQKKYNLALPYLKKGNEIAKNVGQIEQELETNNALATYYAETSNFEEAYTLSFASQKLKDSILTAAQDKNMADALTKFETEKKDAQLRVLELETEKADRQQKLYLMLAIAGLFVAGLIGFFLYKNRKKNKLLAKQKKLLEATVDEKNVLLQETHHRVKNSFQIVSSLLYLQSESIEDKEAKLAMKEAQNRVRSMVLIHQKLYSKDQLVGINTKEYFEDLTQDIFASYQFENNAITHSLDVAPLVLDIETVTPLGLILNELITNVIKHAFNPVTAASKMHIEFKKAGELLVLKVNDTGSGMPSEIKESSFGLQLIKALSKKLKATLSFPKQENGGTQAVLEIKRFTEL
jgi:two-component sensor histidine kinase